jgi:anti-sigma-K factor RsiG
MDVLPDFTTLSDADLRALIEQYVREEEEISYRRRLLHGKIDILRAELVDRVKRRAGEETTAISDVDIDRLTDILAHKGPPPNLDAELDQLDEG